MKKRNIVLLIILVILIIAGFFAYSYRDYLSAFYHVATNTEDQLDIKKEESDKKAIETIKEFGIREVRPLTDEETEKLNKGEITEEEAVKIVLGQSNNEISSDKNDNTNNGEEPKDTSFEEKNKEIAELIGKIYVLKAKYTGELNNVEKWAKDEFKKLSSEEKKDKANKIKIGRKAYTKACNLEAECDRQMETIFKTLESLLKETGQSTQLVDDIKSAYENEKKVKMSYYMDKVM